VLAQLLAYLAGRRAPSLPALDAAVGLPGTHFAPAQSGQLPLGQLPAAPVSLVQQPCSPLLLEKPLPLLQRGKVTRPFTMVVHLAGPALPGEARPVRLVAPGPAHCPLPAQVLSIWRAALTLRAHALPLQATLSIVPAWGPDANMLHSAAHLQYGSLRAGEDPGPLAGRAEAGCPSPEPPTTMLLRAHDRSRTCDPPLTRRTLWPLSYAGTLTAYLAFRKPPLPPLPPYCVPPPPRAGHAERVKGIEPSWPAWKAGALPLSYTRTPRTPTTPNTNDPEHQRPRNS
jgi:hypothetical protein